MTPLLEQFLAEAREFLQGIGDKLMELERAPGNAQTLNELFRLVHTLKGNSGLFDFPEMTRVLHAGEDLMDAVRTGRVDYSEVLADRLLDAMDFVGALCDDIESHERIDVSRADDAVPLAAALRALMPGNALQAPPPGSEAGEVSNETDALRDGASDSLHQALIDLPGATRQAALRRLEDGRPVRWIVYSPTEECFFQGDDPFHTARRTPDLIWGRIVARKPWPAPVELDVYRCALDFVMLSSAPREELAEHFRYVPDQVKRSMLTAAQLADPTPRAITATSSRAPAPLSADQAAATDAIFAAQRRIMMLDDRPLWRHGRLRAVAGVLVNCCRAIGDPTAGDAVTAALDRAIDEGSTAPLLAWLEATRLRHREPGSALISAATPADERTAALGRHPHLDEDPVAPAAPRTQAQVPHQTLADPAAQADPVGAPGDEAIRFGRRSEDAPTTVKSLKVSQEKIDRLMSLIGEMVVSKNALPYLAQRAEEQFGVRELSREIKSQYAVINRIAEEMQDAIMQIRMLPVSFVFQRFPRLVRDISRKLDKEVALRLEGEETEADKNIIEALADPLIHIVRNSLDHGLETPEVRRAAGKPAAGTLTIRANQEGDRVVIEIVDDGKGIDPMVIKSKAYEKGIIDEATFERIGDREAVNLVFAPGLSTAAAISDLSGRGVGMDVVRAAVEKVNGSIALDSEVGKGTRIRISLPLSMAVTQVMIVESDLQIFGVPIEHVVETVRVPRADIRTIRQSQAIVLRGKVVPLRPLNAMLALTAQPVANADDELAVLVARVAGDTVGLLVDDFRETVDVIQKPLAGMLAGLSAYSGSALMGDGSVLMVLNLKELV